jgi:hypothetical protein
MGFTVSAGHLKEWRIENGKLRMDNAPGIKIFLQHKNRPAASTGQLSGIRELPNSNSTEPQG